MESDRARCHVLFGVDIIIWVKYPIFSKGTVIFENIQKKCYLCTKVKANYCFANAIVLGASSKVINLAANKLSLSIATASGLFKGSVTDPSSGKSFAFSGALLQKQNAGAGFLLGTNRSSSVVLGDSTGN